MVRNPATDRFSADRFGSLLDLFGHTWYIATHIDDVPLEETERRMATMAG